MSALWQSGMLCYPEAQATHDEVVASRDLFQSTLESLLTHLGIKLKIPKVSGTEVDLHLLYKEVTGLGGVDLVISRKQWVIVCEPFNFPASFTNKSFVIKKLYLSALYHYEQLYYHRRTAPPTQLPMTAGGGDMASSDSRFPKRKAEFQSESGQIAIVPGHSSSSGSPSAPSMLEAGTRFTGIIDCSFEHGFMITLDLPHQRLQGVLYKEAPTHMVLPSGTGGATPARRRDDTAVSQEFESGMDGGKRMRVMGPNPPRPARTPYQFFQLGVNKDQLLQLHPEPASTDAKDALPKLMSDLWHQMTPDQRQPFLDMGVKDKARYEKEWVEYNRRFQVGSPGGGEETQEGRLMGLGIGGPASGGTPTTSAQPSTLTPGAPQRPAYPRQIRIGVPLKPRGMALPSHPGAPPALPSPQHGHMRQPHGMMSEPLTHHHHYQHQGPPHHPHHPHQHMGHHSTSMPPPRGPLPLSSPPAYDTPLRSPPARIASAPGFHLLPSDMDPEDLEHLCYYPTEEHDGGRHAGHHAGHHPHDGGHFRMDHSMQQDPATHLIPLPDLQHHHHHHQSHHHAGGHSLVSEPHLSPPLAQHGQGSADRPLRQLSHHLPQHSAPDTFGLVSLNALQEQDGAAAAACADIDLFGCSTTVQVNSGAHGGVKLEPGSLIAGGAGEARLPSTAGADGQGGALQDGAAQDGAAQGKPPARSLSTQDIASLSTAASPSDQPASQIYHGGNQVYALPGGAKYPGMYDGTPAASSHYDHQMRELLDHDAHTLPHMFD